MIVGEKYLVPVAVLKTEQRAVVHDLKHNDPENGQDHYHYHADSRFERGGPGLHRINADLVSEIIYALHECLNTQEERPTAFTLLTKFKLPRKCIINGKCPHKGYNLRNIEPIDGIIKCPMHGLEFDYETGKLLTRKFEI